MLREVQSLLFSPFGKISRMRFFFIGVLLALVKLPIDYAVTTYAFHQVWSPTDYIWAKSPFVALNERAALPYYFTMLLIAAPFAWIGVCLSCKRLRAAGAPVWLAILFFIPVAKWFFFAVLTAMATRTSPPEQQGALQPPNTLRGWIAQTGFRSALFSVVVTAVLGILLTFLSVHLLREYGSTLFLGVPFFLGLTAAAVRGTRPGATLRECIAAALLSLCLTGMVLLIFGAEGVVCLLMAMPLAILEGLLGALIGYAFASGRWREALQLGSSAICVLPLLAITEIEPLREGDLHAVTTRVVVNAGRDSVWKNVIAFAEIPPPTELLFRAGIAFPLRATIDGSGVGAIRHCVFSSGEFVEPITAWEAPTRLAFDVSAQPEPLRELTPYGRIDTPHLHGYFESRRGEFKLEALADGRTALSGTTWYVNRVAPTPYWNSWADHIIHTIHRRVLEHIKAEAEGIAAAL